MKKSGKHGFKKLGPEEGLKLLDRQARRYLRMSGPEFARSWKAKKIENPDRPKVMRVAFLLPLMGKTPYQAVLKFFDPTVAGASLS